jgi:hypothetical protein
VLASNGLLQQDMRTTRLPETYATRPDCLISALFLRPFEPGQPTLAVRMHLADSLSIITTEKSEFFSLQITTISVVI